MDDNRITSTDKGDSANSDRVTGSSALEAFAPILAVVILVVGFGFAAWASHSPDSAMQLATLIGIVVGPPLIVLIVARLIPRQARGEAFSIMAMMAGASGLAAFFLIANSAIFGVGGSILTGAGVIGLAIATMSDQKSDR